MKPGFYSVGNGGSFPRGKVAGAWSWPPASNTEVKNKWSYTFASSMCCCGMCRNCFSYLLTYLLTPWSRVLLEKLASLQLVKKFPAFYGTRRLLTALTSVRHLSLSWASPIQSSYPNPTSWRSVLILSSHLRLGLPGGLFPSGFPTSTLYIV